MRLKKCFSNISKLILLASCILSLAACYIRKYEYLGDYPELYSVAINSLLDINGFHISSVIGREGFEPSIHILDEDDYGRVFFSYDEHNFNGPSRIIMQKVDGDYAYFYPHYNFISKQGDWRPIFEPPPEGFRRDFTDEEIKNLKKTNSWNQPMSDSNKFVRVRIVRRKEEGPVSDDKLVEVYKLIIPETRLNTRQMVSNMIFLRTDSYGRAIYSIGEIVVLFQPDHSLDIETGIFEITDRFNYQTELRLFMEANGWDTPFEE